MYLKEEVQGIVDKGYKRGDEWRVNVGRKGKGLIYLHRPLTRGLYSDGHR